MSVQTDFSMTPDGEIRLNRRVELAVRGDWGQANFTRVCGWLAQEVGDRADPGSRFAIWNGRGGRDQAEAVTAGEVDVAIVTPTAGARTMYTGGEGPGGGRALTELRALGILGHRDAVVIAVDAALPVHTVADLASIADRRPVRYLDWGATVFDRFAELGWPDTIVPMEYLPGMDQDLRALDFSNWIVLCREDLDDDIAYLITWCMIRTRQALEARYAHLPPEGSPLVIPIRPSDMKDTPLPLHPAAERAYRDVGDTASADSVMWR
jgi:TRAP-type uncharacterized transport system substrate-binding protein